MSTTTQIILIGMNNQRSAPKVLWFNIRQIVTVPHLFPFEFDISQIAAVSFLFARATWCASMTRWTSYMVMIACAGAAFPS
jgi:hypothetical protein